MSADTLTLNVSGMSCMGCVNSIQNMLGHVPGVGRVAVDLASGQVSISYDADQVQPETLKQTIRDGGYQVVD